MSNSENFRDYPKIIKIDKQGNIMGLDSNGSVNTEFNTNEIDNEDFRSAFGDDYSNLYNKYINANLSRFERNKDTYTDDKNGRPEDYYTPRDREREWENKQENTKVKKANKWLWGLLILFLVIIVAFVVHSCTNNNSEDEAAQDQSNQNTTQNQGNNQDNGQDIEKQDDSIRSDIKDTKQSIKDNQDNTDNKLQSLQNKIDSLKQQSNDDKEAKVADDYQNAKDNLQNAKQQQDNGNDDKMHKELDKVNSKLDDIKNKMKEWFSKD